MKFVKLKTVNSKYKGNSWENKHNIDWVLLLHNVEEVLEYCGHDAKMFKSALDSMRKDEKDESGKVVANVRLDHLSSNREYVLATYISYRALTPKYDGEFVWPHEVLSHIIKGKTKTFLQAVQAGTLQVNKAGGWCHHEHFLKLHNPEIVDEVETKGVEFPALEHPIKAHVLILENGSRPDDDLYAYCKRISKSEKIRAITELKEQDREWIANSVAMCNIIVAETQAVDDDQLDTFMKLFSYLEGKKIHIKTPNKDAIRNHMLFETNNKKHEITFF